MDTTTLRKPKWKKPTFKSIKKRTTYSAAVALVLPFALPFAFQVSVALCRFIYSFIYVWYRLP